jgi:hypothetical protein
MGFASLYPSYNQQKRRRDLLAAPLFVSAIRSQRYFGCGTMRI